MRQACCRRDFAGRLARFVLIGEGRPSAEADAPTASLSLGNEDEHTGGDTDALRQWVDAHPLRLRLRFLATKAFLFWFFIAFLVLHAVLGAGPFSMVIGCMMLWLMGTAAYVAVCGFQ